MVQSCSAYKCAERYKSGSNISFHIFPQDLKLKKQWILAMRRDNFKPSKHTRICSKHFTPDSFIPYPWSSKRNLKNDAVPIIFEFPNYSTKKTPSRKPPTLRKHSQNVKVGNEHTKEKQTTSKAEEEIPIKSMANKRKWFYFGDFREYSSSTSHIQYRLKLKKMLAKKQKVIKMLQQQNRQLVKKVFILKSLLEHLKKQRLIDNDSSLNLSITLNSACCINDCKTGPITYVKNREKIQFFPFPDDEETREKWIKICGKESNFDLENKKVCSKHFDETSYIDNSQDNIWSRTLNPTAVPTLFLSKGTENTVTEMSTQVDNNSCSNVPMETITEAEVKLEYDEESWRNNLLLENKPLPISVEPKVETCMTLRTEVKTEILGNLNNCIFDLFNQLWTCEYAPILPSRAWAIHFVESADSNVICLSKLIKISDNVVCEKKILINNNSIKLYVYGKLFEIGNLNLISSLICIESFQSILETFDNLKLSMNESNNSTSIYDFQHYGTNDYEQNIMPVLTSDIKVEPNIKVEPDIKVELECDV